MKDIPTLTILRELGFDVQINCRWCGLQITGDMTKCCQGQNFDVRYKEKNDREWLTEADCIERIERDGRSEKYFAHKSGATEDDFPW